MPIGGPRRILVVDDSEVLLRSLRRLLEGEGYEVRTETSGRAAIEATREWSPHCILVDYQMPDMNGDDVVIAIRAFDPLVQIVVMTGHEAQRPARDLMRRLDIQGFHPKGQGSEPLLLLVEAALKAHAHLTVITLQTEGMKRILDASPLIHQIQPMQTLAQTALHQALGLDGGAAESRSGFLATQEEDGSLVLRAKSGVFLRARLWAELPRQVHALAERAMATGEMQTTMGDFFAVPIRLADRTTGVMGIQARKSQGLHSLIRLFSNQIALAIGNLHLHDLATVDSLTGLHARRHFLQRLDEWIKLSARDGQPLSLIVVDMDGLKQINDRLGHVAGDVAIAAVGERIRSCVRDTDVPGRYGGDEFMVLAPHTSPKGASIVAERIRAKISAGGITLEGESVALSASVAYGGAEKIPAPDWMRAGGERTSWDELARWFISEVDRALYEAKAAGRDCVVAAGDDGSIEAGLRAFLDRPPA